MSDVKTKQKAEPTIASPGVWRNHWRRSEDLQHIPALNDHEAMITPLPDGSWYGAGFWETREAAEARAAKDLEWNAGEVARCNLSGSLYEYLGPVFFPDDS